METLTNTSGHPYVDYMASVTLFGQQLINGLLFGGLLAIIAIGLTLIWGVTRILNFAHGAMIMIGAYVGLWTFDLTGSIALMLFVPPIVLFGLGVLTDTTVVRTVRDRDDMDIAAIIGTFAVAIILENGVRMSVGASHRTLPSLFPGVWSIGPFNLVVERVALFTVALVALGSLFLIIERTKLGLGMRAVAQDQETAKLMGVRSEYIFAITFGLAAALAGLAGVLLAPIFNIYPSVGWRPFLFAFIIVIIGGLGSVRGTLIAALGIGVLRSVSLIWLSTQAAQILLFVVMILVLYLRPSGIAGVVSE